MNTFTKDVKCILYEGERFLYLHERILFRYFLENFSLEKEEKLLKFFNINNFLKTQNVEFLIDKKSPDFKI